MGDVTVQVKQIVKSYRKNKNGRKTIFAGSKKEKVVDGLSFTVERGEAFGILGPNGAGKTTTLRMLSTLLKPEDGKIEILGLDAGSKSAEIRKHIAFLTDELKMDGKMTPAYLFYYFATLYGKREGMEKRKAELFSYFGIDEYEGTEFSKLSTGMKQKATLAISVAHDPEVIIFDEPTNGLDVVASRQVIDFLQQMKARGKTIVISTHIIDVIEKLCDRVMIMISGKCVECGQLSKMTADKCLEDVFFDIYDKVDQR